MFVGGKCLLHCLHVRVCVRACVHVSACVCARLYMKLSEAAFTPKAVDLNAVGMAGKVTCLLN